MKSDVYLINKLKIKFPTRYPRFKQKYKIEKKTIKKESQ